MAETETIAETYRVEIANLSEDGRDDVLEAIEANPAMTAEDAEVLLDRTEAADAARENFDDLQKEQDQLMKDGEWETARDRAQEAEYEMREVEDLGGDADTEILEAETDVAEIDEAMDEQEMGEQAAADAADYADRGMEGAAEVYGQTASEHAGNAVDNAASAAPNEYNADHDVDGDGVTD
ncbi:ECLF2 upstream ORF [Asticcacaulis biprosthecium C19]|uniref:ECLF2 upstream ORF n=1 Tax=Asticcacaulis biprosthecium C19 TaxID=715226 RepID=F4QGR5_9CAUL|nr:hypothetical protein [Asticcacaulis biprosthecium]EGF92517.1 ECLF2 upstream ORF [Asticcacaulis biprosthecium C19]